MKKLYRFNSELWQMALLVFLLNVLIASCKTGKVQIIPIPDNINKIFQTSCMPCHGSDGGIMATAKLNFAKWDEYDTANREERASKICSVLTAEVMPPKSIRESKPELIPTKEQIELICKWSESLKLKEGKK